MCLACTLELKLYERQTWSLLSELSSWSPMTEPLSYPVLSGSHLLHVASDHVKCGQSELGCAVSVNCALDFEELI